MSKMLRIPPPTSPLCSIAGCEHPNPAHPATRKRGSRAAQGGGARRQWCRRRRDADGSDVPEISKESIR
jgi:hypothetical protein